MSRTAGNIARPSFGQRAHAGTSSRSTMALFGLFLALLLAALMFGALTYQQVEGQGVHTRTSRASLAMLVNTVTGHDGVSTVAVADEGGRLVIRETVGGTPYETAVFLRDGMICQQTSLVDADVSDASVIAVAPSDTLRFDYEDGLLTITTDAGEASVFFRSHNAEGLDQGGNPLTGEVVIL